jgi:hypothetical protein
VCSYCSALAQDYTFESLFEEVQGPEGDASAVPKSEVAEDAGDDVEQETDPEDALPDKSVAVQVLTCDLCTRESNDKEFRRLALVFLNFSSAANS